VQDANKEKDSGKTDEKFFLDITNEVCPMTFVKTKLLLEKMKSGEFACVRLKGAEPLRNVPLSVKEHGHEVISLELEEPGEDKTATHRLIILRK
jgi:TusA-related sulfurtransferase